MPGAVRRYVDLIVLGAAGLFFLGGARYGVAVDESPGPGLAPAVFGAALLLLVVTEGLARFRRESGTARQVAPGEASGVGTVGGWAACFGTLAALTLFGGVIGSFVALLAVATAAIEDRRPRTLAAGALFAAITAAAIYVVFGLLFKLPMIPALIRLP